MAIQPPLRDRVKRFDAEQLEAPGRTALNMPMITKSIPAIASATLVVAALLLTGCQGERTGTAGNNSENNLSRESGKTKIAIADTRIKSEVANLRREIESGRDFGIEVVDKLAKYNELYPNTPEIIDALASVYVARKDWTAISELYRSVDRSLVNENLYIRSLLFAHSYNEAVAFLEQKPDRKLEDNYLLGYALYYNGDNEKAISVLDEVIKQPGGNSADALMIRGLAAIQVDDWDTADAMFSQSLELKADNSVAMTALARVKRKLGDEPFAQLLESRAIESRNEATTIESRMAQMAALSIELNEAWASRELDKCRQIIAKMIPLADEKTKTALDNYLLSIDKLEQ